MTAKTFVLACDLEHINLRANQIVQKADATTEGNWIWVADEAHPGHFAVKVIPIHRQPPPNTKLAERIAGPDDAKFIAAAKRDVLTMHAMIQSMMNELRYLRLEHEWHAANEEEAQLMFSTQDDGEDSSCQKQRRLGDVQKSIVKLKAELDTYLFKDRA